MDAAIKKVLSSLKARKFDPVYFLQGEESYFIDLIAGFIEEHALAEAEKGFNQVIVYGKDVTVATVLTHARRYPMMAEKQVVIVKEAQDIVDLNKELGIKLLLEYLKQPVPSSILVFCHKHKTLDKRKELGKNIDKLATSISGKKLYDNQLPEFLLGYAVEKNVKIDSTAAQALCELVGNDLNRLTNEFDKLTISLPEGETITTDLVLTKVGISKEYNIFELQKAIIQRNLFQAVKIVDYFGRNTKKNPIIPVVAFLYSFFNRLLVASSSSDKSEKGLTSVLKISPYAARDYASALRYYQTFKIAENISLLKDTDLRLKGVNSGSADEGQLLRELVYRLIH
ncbi:MAG: DNA polymerase III subunit delta [Cyclobacteriaceae bacterium]|nr:DNA polymerase III subunit delta [Cyclobacteriaceae bacterium]